MTKAVSKDSWKKYGMSKGILTDLAMNLSDGFRNPLSVILYELERIMELTNKDPTLDREIHTSLYQVKKNSFKIAKILNDLIDNIEADTGRLSPHITQFNIVKTIDDLIVNTKRLLNNHVSFTKNVANKELVIQADENLIERCVLNYLSNAAKHSMEGRKINIALDSDGSEIVVSVMYYGKESRNEEQVFSLYTSKSPKIQFEPESGLGLAKKLVEIQHGRVWFNTSSFKSRETFWGDNDDPEGKCSLYFAIPIRSELEQSSFLIRGSLDIRDRVLMELADINTEI